MIKVCVTGNIGSGKTTVCGIFVSLGVPIFNSDLCAREAEKEKFIQDGFKKILGTDVFVDGILDRPKMRNIIFTNPEKLKEINNFTIPYVKEKYGEFLKQNSKAPFTILESAIIFETGNNKMFDYIIAVIAEKNIRIQRVFGRDNLSKKEIENKMKNQLSDYEKLSKSDFIILNNGKDDLESQVKMIYNNIINIGKTWNKS